MGKSLIWTRFESTSGIIIVLQVRRTKFMMMYVDVDDELIEAAEKLVKTRTLQYDVKAIKDLEEVEHYLTIDQGCVNDYLLDRRLRCDHPIIEEIELLDKQFAREVTPEVYIPTTAENVMRKRLRVDKRGILVEVLLKHGRIRKAEEMYR